MTSVFFAFSAQFEIAFSQENFPEGQLIKNQTFNYSSPETLIENTPVKLWATFYYLPQYINGSGDIALRDLSGIELGPKLSLKQWCHSALEGSVRIYMQNGEFHTYNFQGTSAEYSVDCQSEFKINVGQTKFRITNTPFGDGVNGFQLTPYRTLATDPQIIPTGSVVYIPDARGAIIKLANGETVIHDGYFFAGDRGGGNKGKPY